MALTTASTLSVNKAAYEQLAYFALRPELFFDSMATVKAAKESHRGVSVQFTFNSELAAATTALTDGTDITPVAMSDTTVTLTPLEYGNAVQLTAKAEATAFYTLNPVAANLIGWNAGISTDTLAADAAIAGTKVVYGSGTSRATVTKAGVIDGSDVRRARAYLAGKNVQTFGGTFKGIIHPDAAYDLTGGTGGTNWSDPHVYSAPEGIFNGVIGTFQGVQFMETPRSPLVISDGGAAIADCTTQTVSGNTASLTIIAHGLVVGDTVTLSGGTATSGTGSSSQLGFNRQFTVTGVTSADIVTVDITGITATSTAGTGTLTAKSVDVYCTLIMGREALAKAYSTGGGYGAQAQIVDVPVTDVLRRNTGIGWKHFVDYSVFRQDAMYRIETGSALGI